MPGRHSLTQALSGHRLKAMDSLSDNQSPYKAEVNCNMSKDPPAPIMDVMRGCAVSMYRRMICCVRRRPYWKRLGFRKWMDLDEVGRRLSSVRMLSLTTDRVRPARDTQVDFSSVQFRIDPRRPPTMHRLCCAQHFRQDLQYARYRWPALDQR